MAASDVSAHGMSGDTGGLFIRQTSGLVRELGIPAAVGISLASVAVVNTFITFNAGLTAFAKADMYLPLIAGAVIWLASRTGTCCVRCRARAASMSTCRGSFHRWWDRLQASASQLSSPTSCPRT